MFGAKGGSGGGCLRFMDVGVGRCPRWSRLSLWGRVEEEEEEEENEEEA